ncbi:MAG TPA: TonB-dependent receptor plug domain-containing protein, partial [Opitutaceae bacterium]
HPIQMEQVRIEQRRDFGITTQSILRADPAAPLYHYVATRADIEQAGVTNMAEFLTTVPGFSGEGAEALQATADFTFLGGANVYAGSFLKLRGWDAQHTTALLNGRRLPTSPESRGPDLSRIPLAAVERIEVMPFAGSAIYGDGAVGGAMNIVLRKDFAGRSFSLQLGESTRGGGGELFLSWIEGLASRSGRTRATIIGDYQRRGALRLADRDFIARALARLPEERLLPSGGTLGGDLSLLLRAQITGYPSVIAVPSAATDLGIPGQPGARFALVPEGRSVTQLDPAGAFSTDPGALSSRRQDRVVLRRPTETYNLNVQFEHTLAPTTLELYGELGYARADERFFAPDAIDPLTLSATDPRNPFHSDLARGIPGRSVRVYFDPADLPDARFRQTRDSLRTVLGARGVLGGQWTWVLDGYFDLSRSRARVRSYGATLNDITRLWASFNAAALSRYYDPLADHRTSPVDPALREQYLARDSWLDYHSRMAGADFRVGGVAAQLPAGPLRLALGAEYAWHDFQTRQQVLASRELYADLAVLDAASSFRPVLPSFEILTALRATNDRSHRLGGVAEAIVPLLHRSRQRLPIQNAELNLASRAARTGDGRPAWSSLAALKVAPTTSWALRATLSQGHLTPDGSLVHAPTTENPTLVVVRDPERGNTRQFYSVKTIRGGSRAVRAETSHSRVIGLVATPAALPGFFASVDAWSISMKDRLRAPTVQEIVNHAEYFPGKLQRSTPQPWESLLGWAGPISVVDLRPVHVTRLRAKGIDVTARYRLPATALGTFTLSSQLEIVSRYEEQFLPSAPAVDKVDIVADASSGGLMESAVVSPRTRSSLSWRQRGWFASLSASYTPRYRTESTKPTPALPGASGIDGETIGSSTRWDLQIGHEIQPHREPGLRRWLSGSTWTLGVRNLLDTTPPYRSDGTSFYSRFEDPRMRFVYVRTQWRR